MAPDTTRRPASVRLVLRVEPELHRRARRARVRTGAVDPVFDAGRRADVVRESQEVEREVERRSGGAGPDPRPQRPARHPVGCGA